VATNSHVATKGHVTTKRADGCELKAESYPEEAAMNRRFALIAAACLVAALTPSLSHAQAKPAAPTAAPAAAEPTKWIPPVKGEATIEFIESLPTKSKGEILTKMKVRNTSKGSIALLSVEEYWYTKNEIGSNGIYRHKKLLNPGEIIEFTISAPDRPGLDGRNMLLFKHVNGTIKPTKVKKIP
jgi:hypothetical protein